MTSVLRAPLAAAVVVVCVSGCPQPERPQELLPSGLRPVAVDSVKRGELAESKEEAFGLPIPRDMHVEARMSDTVYARGTLKLEVLSNYVRARVKAKRVETGPSKTVFQEAALARDPSKVVEVEVVEVEGSRVEMVIRNRTRPPAQEGLTEEQRWRQAGLTPDGEVIEEQNK